MTEREKSEKAYRRKVLALAKEHDNAREIENVQRYHMPDEMKEKVKLSLIFY